MNVMTSCSLRPARRARKPPMAWMPSWELPAMRMIASEILEIFGDPPGVKAVDVVSLMKVSIQFRLCYAKVGLKIQREHRCLKTLSLCQGESNSNRPTYVVILQPIIFKPISIKFNFEKPIRLINFNLTQHQNPVCRALPGPGKKAMLRRLHRRSNLC